jgi:hypothetical protein
MAELSWLTLSIGRSGLLGYNNGANTTGTSSRGKSRRRLFKKVSFVSDTIPGKKKKEKHTNKVTTKQLNTIYMHPMFPQIETVLTELILRPVQQIGQYQVQNLRRRFV